MVYLLNTERFDDGFTDKVREAEKLIFENDKLLRGNRLTLFGRVLLGYILNKNYGIESFSYRYGENGKPYLENSDVYFNISHSGNMVLCSISEYETGCDIEKIKDYNPKIAKRFFTEKETNLLENKDTEDYIFARLWTLKESILKKSGRGISGGLDTYCFSDYADKEVFSAHGCNFLCYPHGEYMISVCSADKPQKPVVITEKEIRDYINEINQKNT